ncbi:Ribonuclease BN, tRNA processing enzyme [Alteribacillus persepolensis]|uniref:Ribonuclease BN, tRNA processing enzyme n=1 Tax=Alteribacillus persepolensis TaxID=568899 RepID=A0A1G8GMN5_9BACI|nr:MBL fold metallo-hydrolase [Alteribacillus persepolensis]SDH95664.1 Ribonuclease BN, tRNA processing enzyme [Alteribacillus persepolensis]
MKVTVIGYWHAFPKKGEAASGYLVEHDNYRVLVDCGSGVVSQLQHYCELEDLDAVVISHYHNDHIGDIGALHYFRLLTPYISQKAAKPFAVYGHQEDVQGFQRLSYKDVVNAIPYNENQTLDIGPFQFSFYKTSHPVPCYAMKIQTSASTLFYTADTGYMPELAEAAKGADLLIAECSLYKGQDGTPAGHMNSEEAGKLANAADVPALLLTHLPHFGDHGQLKKEAQAQCPSTIIDTASAGWSKTLST